uniref:Reverse transcriptase domain-containing protein n=1 Tax=Triticum urartu TaxID=4572 RepID=A0A8R7RAS2_TRIUA
MGHFRPISLIHSVTKLIAKVLSMRLAPKLKDLISPAQTAFQKGKCIHDSYQYVQGCVRALHRDKKSALLFKLDIAKAFDSVSWEYLMELLQRMGFSSRWRDWIAMLLSSASSSILMNGEPGEKFWHRQGLRQGDPFSPLLFIIAIGPLHRL